MTPFSKFCLLTFLFPTLSYANIGPQGFGGYPNEYFVETGTYRGDGIARALNDGFKQVLSLELSCEVVEAAKQRFAGYDNVHLYCGDSSRDLWAIIKPIDKKITFWLDGHNMFPTPGSKNCPLLEELEQIKWHPIKTHTILIDDMHCLDTVYFDFLTREKLIEKIYEINPNYKISYMVGGDLGTHPNNIMIATID
jgi:hypothetical protein